MTELEHGAKVIADAIQATNGAAAIADGSLLVGYLVIAEWSAPNGEHYLSQAMAAGDGSLTVNHWTRDGWLHTVLHNWPYDEARRDADA